jgi:hypothetical protein
MKPNKYNDRTQRLLKRNEEIRAEFEKLSEKKIHGQKLYTQQAKFAILANQFYLSKATIEDIVFFNDKNSKKSKQSNNQ